MNFHDDILDKIERKRDLPTLPDIAVKLSRMITDGHSSAPDIAKVLQFDPVLAGRVLHLANSTIYGTSSRVGSVSQAVTRIGFKRLKDLVLSLTLMQAFSHCKTRLDFRSFWRHSLAVAFASQVIERRASHTEGPTDNSFAAGLLHDIGILLFYMYANDSYQQVVTYARLENHELHEAETTILGIDHAEAGALLLEHWNLPLLVWESTRYHHQPYPQGFSTDVLAKVVHLANFACNNQGISNGVETFPSTFSSSAWYDVGLSVDDIPEIIDEVNRLTAEADAIIAIAH
jgi:HD-like signal output (HDOD) protein